MQFGHLQGVPQPMVANYILNGMILQAMPPSPRYKAPISPYQETMVVSNPLNFAFFCGEGWNWGGEGCSYLDSHDEEMRRMSEGKWVGKIQE